VVDPFCTHGDPYSNSNFHILGDGNSEPAPLFQVWKE